MLNFPHMEFSLLRHLQITVRHLSVYWLTTDFPFYSLNFAILVLVINRNTYCDICRPPFCPMLFTAPFSIWQRFYRLQSSTLSHILNFYSLPFWDMFIIYSASFYSFLTYVLLPVLILWHSTIYIPTSRDIFVTCSPPFYDIPTSCDIFIIDGPPFCKRRDFKWQLQSSILQNVHQFQSSILKRDSRNSTCRHSNAIWDSSRALH